MSYNIFIIDDGFMGPATAKSVEGHRYFPACTVRIFLEEDDWGHETSLKSLCSRIINDQTPEGGNKWQLFGFTTPQYFLDAFDEENLRADLIVFDWEYSTALDVDHKSILLNIFTNSHSHVFIFSGVDKEDEIRKFIREELTEYEGRINYFAKENENIDTDSYNQLHQLLEEKNENNFSFKFGRELRKVTNRSLDNVLLHLSEMDIEKVVDLLGKQGADPIDMDLKELIGIKIKDKLVESPALRQLARFINFSTYKVGQLIEFISEKVRNDIVASALPHTRVDREGAIDVGSMEKLWSYRLYHHPFDEYVRTGDIICPTGTYDGTLYVVLTPLCDLARFWAKTNSQLNLVRLLDIETKKDDIKRITLEVKSPTKAKPDKVTSLTNCLSEISGGPFLIPFVKVENQLRNFALFPKTISFVDIPVPAEFSAQSKDIRKNAALKYAHMGYQRVCTVSQPFLSPMIDGVMSALLGVGSPDYNEELQKHLADKMGMVFDGTT